MFCPSISYLPNGEILVAGGSSSDHTSIYNPFLASMARGPMMPI
jgi:hypothetical protein